MPRLLTEMMHSYFEEAEHDQGQAALPHGMPFQVPNIKVSSAPIKPTRKSDWEVGRAPRCLRKTFEFKDPATMAAFVQELLSHEIETGHHGKLLCEYPQVCVEVRTHDLDDVTELDQAYAKTCDQIFEDVKHYNNRGNSGMVW